ncbi:MULTISPECIES: hypothetical protein [unclassified Streptomyces]|nr:hypothetical protein [Streptomyces sp. NBC_00690]
MDQVGMVKAIVELIAAVIQFAAAALGAGLVWRAVRLRRNGDASSDGS